MRLALCSLVSRPTVARHNCSLQTSVAAQLASALSRLTMFPRTNFPFKARPHEAPIIRIHLAHWLRILAISSDMVHKLEVDLQS